MKSGFVFAVFASACSVAMFGQASGKMDDMVHLNQIQVIGTHNSYHAGIAPNEAALWQKKNPKLYEGLEYRHAPLPEQFSAGVRQIELDVFSDQKGGLYADPAGPKLVKAAGLPADSVYDPQGERQKPGFKVFHVQDIDYRSTCTTLVDCLTEVRDWSHAHPDHLPLFILIEAKSEPLHNSVSTVVPEPYTPETFDRLDKEILSVFAPQEIITPDAVRGTHETLPEAIQTNGWPTLSASRGKVVFLLDNRKLESTYVAGHPSLKGRVLFTNATPGAPDAAFTEENEGSAEEIQSLVRKGYLVRTRTDENTAEARVNDTRKRETALTSGAQLLSTDYPASEPAKWTGYFVSFPGGVVARCNPVLALATCKDAPLDRKY